MHADSYLLEHISTDFLIERLSEFLGNPTEGPHGEFIPNAEGFLEISSFLLSLNQLEIGQAFTI